MLSVQGLDLAYLQEAFNASLNTRLLGGAVVCWLLAA
jgi:hypothetical protein